MVRFKIIAGGQSRLYDLLDDSITAGSAPSNAIVLPQDDVAEVHARVWRAADGVWVSPVDSASLRVNGEVSSRHRLRHGDRVEIGAECALEFVDPASARTDTAKPAPSRPARASAPPAPQPLRSTRPHKAAADEPARERLSPKKLVVPSSAREARERRSARDEREERDQGRRGRAAPKGPSWHLISGVVLLVVAGVWIGIRVASGSGGEGSAADLLALAESQLARGNPTSALQTVQTAATRAAGDTDMLRRLAEFEVSIKKAVQVTADAPMLDMARQASDNLRVFEKSHLASTPTARPACREVVRMADAWRERYAAVCERSPEAARLVQEVAAMRSRYAAAAQLDQPDNAEDVVFAAKRSLRLKRPRYREAVASLDAFIGRGGDAAALEHVRTFRADLVETGRTWFTDRLTQLKREWERGRVDTVLSEVDAMLAESVIDDWRPELEALAKRWKQEAGR